MTEKNALEHHGIKGMRWGVRRNKIELQSKGVTIDGERSTVTLHPQTGRIVTASPNLRGKPAEDAVKAKVAKARVKSQSLDALSNQELQHLVNRMNLEQQYSRLTIQEKSALTSGHKRVKDVLALGKTVDEAIKFKNSPTGQALSIAIKAAKVVA
jgi:hypothetical protein